MMYLSTLLIEGGLRDIDVLTRVQEGAVLLARRYDVWYTSKGVHKDNALKTVVPRTLLHCLILEGENRRSHRQWPPSRRQLSPLSEKSGYLITYRKLPSTHTVSFLDDIKQPKPLLEFCFLFLPTGQSACIPLGV